MAAYRGDIKQGTGCSHIQCPCASSARQHSCQAHRTPNACTRRADCLADLQVQLLALGHMSPEMPVHQVLARLWRYHSSSPWKLSSPFKSMLVTATHADAESPLRRLAARSQHLRLDRKFPLRESLVLLQLLLCLCLELVLCELPPDGAGLLGPQVQGQVLLVCVCLPEGCALVL